MVRIKAERVGVTDGISLDKVRKKQKLLMYAEKFKPDVVLNGSHLYPELVQLLRQWPPSSLLPGGKLQQDSHIRVFSQELVYPCLLNQIWLYTGLS